MNNLHFSQEQLVQVAKLSDADMALIDECRGEQNKLGLGYQLGFVHLFNKFPAQVPFEPIEDLVTYMAQLQHSCHQPPHNFLFDNNPLIHV